MIDQQVFPPARQPELKGATEAQHQLGNDHIVAAAFNHGYTQLWSQDRLPQWANRFDPENGHYGGGFGYLNVGGRVVSTLYLDRPRGSRSERLFGTGYYERRLRAAGLEVARARLRPVRRRPAPAARRDDPQPHAAAAAGLLVRVLGREPVHRGGGPQPCGRDSRVDAEPQDAHGAAGGRRPRRRAAAEHLRRGAEGPDGGHETSAARFFGSGTRAAPAAVAADRLSGSTAPDGRHAARLPRAAAAAAGPVDHAALRLRHGAPRRSRPAGARSTAKRGIRSRAMRGRWAAWLPKADFGPGRAWAARELQWDAYLLRTRLGLRGGVRAPHDHPGRLLPVQRGRQPRLAQLAPLPAADGLRRSRARARDPPLQRRGPVRDGGRSPTGCRRCARTSERSAPRTTSTSGCCSRPPSTASAHATCASSGSGTRSPTRPRRPPSGST